MVTAVTFSYSGFYDIPHYLLLSPLLFHLLVSLRLSDQGVKLLREVMVTNDTIRYRVYDVIIDSILTTDQALECAVTVGFFSNILEVDMSLYGIIYLLPNVHIWCVRNLSLYRFSAGSGKL